MDDDCIGRVTHYYSELHVAVLALTDMIRVGDWLHLTGYTTDFVQPVTSLQINHRAVPEAGPGQEVALKVADRAHVHDLVYRITQEEAKQLETELAPYEFW